MSKTFDVSVALVSARPRKCGATEIPLEGYVAASVLLQGVKRAGPHLDTERLVEGLETLRDFDMGLGTLIGFSPSDHQCSHKVWGTQLDNHGRYQPIDLE